MRPSLRWYCRNSSIHSDRHIGHFLLFEEPLNELRAGARISLSTLRAYLSNVENAGLQTTLSTLQRQLLAAAAFSYLTLIQTFELHVKIVFLGRHTELLYLMKGLCSAMSSEKAETMITGGLNHFENACRSPR
jgi:hypothetical protein